MTAPVRGRFRRRPPPLEERLERWRAQWLPAQADLAPAVEGELRGLGLEPEGHAAGVRALLGRTPVNLAWLAEERLLVALLVSDEPGEDELLARVRANEEPDLAVEAIGVMGRDTVGLTKVVLPLERPGRVALARGLEALARRAGEAEAEQALRAAGDAPRGEAAEQAAAAAAARELEALLAAVGLEARRRLEASHAWEVETEDGPLHLVVRDTGEAVSATALVDTLPGPPEPALARWLLESSEAGGRRLGARPLPGGSWAVAAGAVVPTARPVEPQAIAWALAEVARLRRLYAAAG